MYGCKIVGALSERPHKKYNWTEFVGADAHISPTDQRKGTGDSGIAPYIFTLAHMRQIPIYTNNYSEGKQTDRRE